MKKVFAFSILLLAGFSCSRTESGIDFCMDCALKTDVIEIIDNKDGWLVFDNILKKYMIEVAHYNDPIVYVPCEFPVYLDAHEMLSVRFSGTVTCDPFTTGDKIITTMYCIKLDTIFIPNVKMR
jgi:hypothetical protein